MPFLGLIMENYMYLCTSSPKYHKIYRPKLINSPFKIKTGMYLFSPDMYIKNYSTPACESATANVFLPNYGRLLLSPHRAQPL